MSRSAVHKSGPERLRISSSTRTYQSSAGPNHAAARRTIGIAAKIRNNRAERPELQERLFTIVSWTGEMLDSGRDLSSGLLRQIAGEKTHTLGSQRLGLLFGQKPGIASASG